MGGTSTKTQDVNPTPVRQVLQTRRRDDSLKAGREWGGFRDKAGTMSSRAELRKGAEFLRTAGEVSVGKKKWGYIDNTGKSSVGATIVARSEPFELRI